MLEWLGAHGAAPHLLSMQEHRLASPESCRVAEDWGRRNGFDLSVAPARRTGVAALETSGGVLLGVRRGIAMSPVEHKLLAKHQGKVHAAVVNAIFPGGFLLVSVYARDGLQDELLEGLGVFLQQQQQRRPWLASGGWNATPEELIDSGWPHMVGGTVRAPTAATCTRGLPELYFRNKVT